MYKALRETRLVHPGSPEWLQLMTASKVSAVLGVSPWESTFSLWHRMNGTLDAQPVNVDQERGHFHEDGVRKWFKAEHPELRVRPNRWLWRSRRDARFAATPDGFVIEPDGSRAGVEIKTSAYEDWVDGVPVHYRVQCVWQAHIIGLRRVYVAALTKNLRHVEHVIEYDPLEGDWIEEQVRQFLDSLHAGTPPPVDGHDATTQAIRDLHPDIDPTEIELPEHLAERVIAAKNAHDIAKDLLAETKNLIADEMGTAQKATCGGHPVASRLSKQGGTPYVQLARRLPDATQLTNREAIPA